MVEIDSLPDRQLVKEPAVFHERIDQLGRDGLAGSKRIMIGDAECRWATIASLTSGLCRSRLLKVLIVSSQISMNLKDRSDAPII